MHSLIRIATGLAVIIVVTSAAPQELQRNQQLDESNQRQYHQQNEQQYHQRPIENHQPLNSESTTTPVPIINYVDKHGPDGSFNFSYEAGNGIKTQQSGMLKRIALARFAGDGLPDDAPPREAEILVQTGTYSYMAPDGSLIMLSYTADENGFQPVGDHLPTTPPVPESIQRFLQNEDRQTTDFNRAHASGPIGAQQYQQRDQFQRQQQTQQLGDQPNRQSAQEQRPALSNRQSAQEQRPTLLNRQSAQQISDQPTFSNAQQSTLFQDQTTLFTVPQTTTASVPIRQAQNSNAGQPADSVSQALAESGTLPPQGSSPNFEVIKP